MGSALAGVRRPVQEVRVNLGRRMHDCREGHDSQRGCQQFVSPVVVHRNPTAMIGRIVLKRRLPRVSVGDARMRTLDWYPHP